MRTRLIFFFILCFFSSCLNNSGNNESPGKIKQKAIKVAENHAREQINDAEKSLMKDSLIVYSGGNMKCLIDPSYILTGEIDEDTNLDAIVSMFFFRDQTLAFREHLILINKGGKLIVSKIMDGDMKFLSIKDRAIYIETSKIASDSPLYGCKICKEVNKYQFINGDTIRMK
jgi:hypothetical protein